MGGSAEPSGAGRKRMRSGYVFGGIVANPSVAGGGVGRPANWRGEIRMLTVRMRLKSKLSKG